MDYGEQWIEMGAESLAMALAGIDERCKESRALRKKISVHLANASDEDLKSIAAARKKYLPQMPSETFEDLKKLRQLHQERQKNKRRW